MATSKQELRNLIFSQFNICSKDICNQFFQETLEVFNLSDENNQAAILIIDYYDNSYTFRSFNEDGTVYNSTKFKITLLN